MKATRTTSMILGAVAALLLAAPAGATTKKIPAAGITAVEIKTGRVEVRIEAAAAEVITLDAGPELERAVLVADGRLRVSDKPGMLAEPLDLGDLLTVKLPAHLPVEVKTASGAIVVSGLQAKLRAGTASGKVTVRNCRGPVNLRGVSGDILIEDVAGDISVSAVSATVRARQVSSPLLEIQTVSGGIDIDAAGLERVRTRAVSGDTVLAGRPAAHASLVAASVSGDVELRLPADCGFELGFGTVSGSFASDFSGERKDKHRKVHLRVGDGSVSVKVGTVSGDLSVRKLP